MSEKPFEEVQVRKLLLDFYSSELTTHSRLIIGFAALLFTILTVYYNVKPTHIFQQSAVFFGVFCLSAILWFLIMRHLVYGVLSSSALHANLTQATTIHQALERTRNHALNNHMLLILPVCLFMHTDCRIKVGKVEVESKYITPFGTMLCVGLGLITAATLVIIVTPL